MRSLLQDLGSTNLCQFCCALPASFHADCRAAHRASAPPFHPASSSDRRVRNHAHLFVGLHEQLTHRCLALIRRQALVVVELLRPVMHLLQDGPGFVLLVGGQARASRSALSNVVQRAQRRQRARQGWLSFCCATVLSANISTVPTASKRSRFIVSLLFLIGEPRDSAYDSHCSFEMQPRREADRRC